LKLNQGPSSFSSHSLLYTQQSLKQFFDQEAAELASEFKDKKKEERLKGMVREMEEHYSDMKKKYKRKGYPVIPPFVKGRPKKGSNEMVGVVQLLAMEEAEVERCTLEWREKYVVASHLLQEQLQRQLVEEERVRSVREDAIRQGQAPRGRGRPRGATQQPADVADEDYTPAE
jgi:hypothetical protein